MPWETADTVWTVICVIVILALALAVWAMREARDALPCICDDSDNCTCGGAWGGREP